MIKSNDFFSAGREDDLLRRLKECVGSIETNSKDPQSRNLVNRAIPKVSSIQQAKIQRTRQTLLSNRPSLSSKQNLTDKKTYIRHQEYREFTGNKQNTSDILKLTKNYLQNTQQKGKTYRTQRKKSLPLAEAEVSIISNDKKQLFIRQGSQRKPYSGLKDVSDSTRKRIAERQSLINGQIQKVSPLKIFQKPRNTHLSHNSEDEFLQRLSLRKAGYLNDSHQIKQRSLITSKKDYEQSGESSNSFEKTKNLSTQLIQKQQQRVSICSTKLASEKFQNYSKVAMEDLIKQSDMRKAEKMQKLKKITDMNEEINKRIRRIVDNFQNYLTHRQMQ